MKPKILWAILLLCAPVVVAAQVPPAAPPALAPEIGLLAYFLGTWNVETVALPSQAAAETPAVSVQAYERLDGTGFVVMRSKKASLPEVEMAVFGYDPRQRLYTAEYFTVPFSRVSMAGRASGESWTWISRDGQLRQTLHMLSPSAFTFEVARSRRAGGWLTVAEGKAVRIEAVPAAPEP